MVIAEAAMSSLIKNSTAELALIWFTEFVRIVKAFQFIVNA